MPSTQGVSHTDLLAELLNEYVRARQHSIEVEVAYATRDGYEIHTVANPEDDEIVKRVRAALG